MILTEKPPHKAFIFDRDGVINQELGRYVTQPEDFLWEESVFDLAKAVQDEGFLLFIITNQGGVSKGATDLKIVHQIHQIMLRRFEDAGIRIQDLWVCYHHPDFSKCLCRKPESLFFERCLAKYKCSPELSFMIGDRDRDLSPAKKLGLTTLLIGHEKTPSADFQFDTVKDAFEKRETFLVKR